MKEEKPGKVDVLTMQVTFLMCATEALIATHPEPDKLRQQFDQLYGQQLAGMIATGTTPLATQTMRAMAEKVFSASTMPPAQ